MNKYFFIQKTDFDSLAPQIRKQIVSLSVSKDSSAFKTATLSSIEYYIIESPLTESLLTPLGEHNFFDAMEAREIIDSGEYSEEKNTTIRDKDSVPFSQTKIVPTGWSFHAPNFSFKCGVADSVDFTDKFGNDMSSMCNLKFFNSSAGYGTFTPCDPGDATMTVVDFNPPYPFYIVSGKLHQVAKPTANHKVYATLAPYVPYEQGGSREFICCSNLRFKGLENAVESDGKAPKYVPFVTINEPLKIYSNTIEIVVTHPAGTTGHEIEVEVGLYRE